MPELPEVETIVRDLRPLLLGRRIRKVSFFAEKPVPPVARRGFIRAVASGKIVEIRRRAKFLLFFFSSGKVLLVHLRISGQLVFQPKGKAEPEHGPLRVRFEFPHGSLLFCDLRKFGTMRVIEKSGLRDAKELKSLGPEPLSPAFTFPLFRQMLKKSKQPLKLFLLDQRKIAGLGNIYAAEALFRAGASPFLPAQKLGEKKAHALFAAIKQALRQGISSRGASVEDYVDAEGKEGKFQALLRVYGREGEKCGRCKGEIKRKKQGGRSTYYCPLCQK